LDFDSSATFVDGVTSLGLNSPSPLLGGLGERIG